MISVSVQLAFLIFATHGFILAVDEFFFHRRRELPAWERLGHPMDTLTVFLPLAILWAVPPTPNMRFLFVLLAIFSCFFVTKDETVHKQYCERAEFWLHALLFMLHPALFYAGWQIWPELHSAEGNPVVPLVYFLLLLGILLFGIYQFIYWNVFEPSKRQGKDFY